MAKTRVVIALGSNLGDRGEHIQSAAEQIGAIEGVKLVKLSGIMESFAITPAGVDESKPKYLNAVALVDTSLKAKELLAALQNIENQHGRVRLEKWGSRTLDLDIIDFGGQIKAGKELLLPHPRAYQRAFVMVPWAQLDPEAILPGHGSVAELAADLAEDPKQKVWFL
ncbi:MAG: 2-amino-4-hydroxy-6-hydroxymethyldihydropteridine diphosphokinase [Actinomycetales bacterium]|nr:2-amino-4-hydroxy-6-hydroxymethyldihydropteridine diphosphokinase [Actinomycetales bacterium]